MKPKLIGEIKFSDREVKVYYDSDREENDAGCVWQARNPKSFYEGTVYMAADGKITYPEGAVIPEQTKEDREMLPKFIIIGQDELTESIIENLSKYLEKEHKRRNGRN